MRRIRRAVDEHVRDLARGLATTPAFEASRHRRKKVEMLFAHLKRILRLSGLRLRGPMAPVAATAQNHSKLAMLRPSPASMLATG
jgi:hypothetical protein